MKYTGKASLAATTVLLLTALTGCGLTGGSTASESSPAASVTSTKDDSIAKLVPADIAKTGTISVGTSAASPPEGFKTESGSLDGYEVRLMDEIGATLGLKVDWQVTEFASLIPGLSSNRFGLATGQIGITKDRATKVDFVTLIMIQQSFAALKGSGLKDITINDLCGRKVAVMQGSRQQDFGETQSKACVADGKKAIDLNVFQNTNDAWLSMQSKRTDIYWAGSTNVSYLVGKSSDAEVVGHHLNPYPTGIALSKNSPMGPAIQAALEKLIENGTYTKIISNWGLEKSAVTKAELNPKITW
jgi:polar amino acid transport system substrate-binding protein